MTMPPPIEYPSSTTPSEPWSSAYRTMASRSFHSVSPYRSLPLGSSGAPGSLR